MAERPSSLNEQQKRRTWTSCVASTCLHVGVICLTAFVATTPEQFEIEIARGQAITIDLSEPKKEPAPSASFEVDVHPEESDSPTDALDEQRTQLEKLAKFELPTILDAKMEPDLQLETAIFAVTPVRYEHDVAPRALGSKSGKRQKVKSSVALAGFTTSSGTVRVVPVDEGAKFNVPPKKLPENKPPVYPDREQRAGIEGRVTLIALVGSNGRVARVAVQESSGSLGLDESAMAAVRTWRFSPALLDDNPVEAEILVPIRFAIR